MDNQILTTIITGVFSLLGIIVTAYFNYKGKKLEREGTPRSSSSAQTWMIIFGVLLVASWGYYFYANNATPEKSTVAEAGIHKFDGEIRFVKGDGTEMPASFSKNRGIGVKSTAKNGNYKLRNPYSSGTEFKVYLKANQDAYVYAITERDDGSIAFLFPYREGNIVYTQAADDEIPIPKGNATFTLDNQPKTELFCMLYSKVEIDTQKLKKDMNKRKGESFIHKLSVALGDRLVEPDAINYANKRIHFSAESKKSILPIVVAIEHVQ